MTRFWEEKFEPDIFCQMLDEINRYFLSQDQKIRPESLPIIEGLTQIASCSKRGCIVFEAAKAAAGALLHHLKNRTLEPDKLLYPTKYVIAPHEACRRALCVNLRSRDMTFFIKYMKGFANDLMEIETDGLNVYYRFDPFE